ncbi:unnamed protein product, partial [Hymenolepis diminuta]
SKDDSINGIQYGIPHSRSFNTSKNSKKSWSSSNSSRESSNARRNGSHTPQSRSLSRGSRGNASKTLNSRSLSRKLRRSSKNQKLISPSKRESRELPGKRFEGGRSSGTSSASSFQKKHNFASSPRISKTCRRNNRHSRSSSREEADYYCGIQHRDSMQSTSNSIDSAGSLLLGRHVLVPRRDHGNRLYLGVIKTQKKDKRFGVVFCIPYAGHGGDDGLEYCMQEVDIDDILSYTDLYRHAICENDDVLVPAILLQPHNTGTSLQIDPPFAGHPYILAVVHKGFEPRSSRITRSPGRKTSTLVVKLAGGRRPRLCDIPAGCALWIPEKQARQLYSQGCHFFDQQEADTRDSSPDHGERESLCMHGAPTSPSRNTDIDDA